jgi:DNA topoisomerase-1
VTTDPAGRLQATGLDTKGRRVYLYSKEQAGKAAAAKFDRLKAFDRAYPSLIRKVERDMKTREEALVLYLIAKTGFRVGGSSETGAEVQAYGASTLKCSQVSVSGSTLSFDFTGKKGVRVNKALKDAFLARGIGDRCYSNSEEIIFNTTDRQVRSYLASIQRETQFMVKDFRTYLGTLTAFRKVRGMPAPRNDREFRSFRRKVGEAVAGELGNTPTIALNSYVAPEVFCAWEAGEAAAVKDRGSKRISMADEFLECVHYRDSGTPK